MKFRSGSWTCYPEFKPKTPYRIQSYFKNDSLSNNHLLAGEEEINKAIMEAKTGDQIYLKGYLIEYSHSNGGFLRRSSTSRTDNRCETIYVTDFQILKKANPQWRSIYTITKYSIISCLILLLILFFVEVYVEVYRPIQRTKE